MIHFSSTSMVENKSVTLRSIHDLFEALHTQKCCNRSRRVKQVHKFQPSLRIVFFILVFSVKGIVGGRFFFLGWWLLIGMLYIVDNFCSQFGSTQLIYWFIYFSFGGVLAQVQVVASYVKEECTLEACIQLPPEYPLRSVEVSCTRRMGVSENR